MSVILPTIYYEMLMMYDGVISRPHHDDHGTQRRQYKECDSTVLLRDGSFIADSLHTSSTCLSLPRRESSRRPSLIHSVKGSIHIMCLTLRTISDEFNKRYQACSGFPVALINNAGSASCHNHAIIDRPRREAVFVHSPLQHNSIVIMSSTKRPPFCNQTNDEEEESIDSTDKKKETVLQTS